MDAESGDDDGDGLSSERDESRKQLICWLRRNAEAFCHKHFVVVSREKQTTPLTSDWCHKLATVSCSCVYCTWRSNRSRHATPALGGGPVGILPLWFGMEELEWWIY